MVIQRLPLPTILQPRDATLTKDGILTNCYLEIDPAEGPQIVKRPGYTINSTLGGAGQGAFRYGSISVFVAGDTLYTL